MSSLARADYGCSNHLGRTTIQTHADFNQYGGMTELGLLCVPAKNCALKGARGFESLFHRHPLISAGTPPVFEIGES